jgi:hypothetical protein
LQLGVFRFVNHLHAAFAELFDDFVVRYGFADHSRPPRLRQSPDENIAPIPKSKGFLQYKRAMARVAIALFKKMIED